MYNLKSKTLQVLIGLTLTMVAACSSNTSNTSNAPSAAQPTVSTNSNANAAANAASAPPALPTALPTRAVVASTSVAVDGVLTLTVPSISLGFDVSSKVVSVTATAGQSVKKGDVLATVDDTALRDAVADAQLALDLVQANINLQNVPATKENLTAAQAVLNAAYASYSATKAGSTQSDIDNAKRSVDAAWLQYLNAQVSRDGACAGPEGTKGSECKAQEAAYGNAFESWLSARDSLQKLLEPVSQNTLTQSYASVTSAQAKLDALKAGETAQQSKIDEAQVAQARATLEQAQNSLSEATLVSPCDCVVQEVNVTQGVVPPSTAFVLVDLGGIQFQTTNLVEGDVAKIQVGAPVSLRLKPYSDVFSGTVSTVLSKSAGTQSGQALFTVLIGLNRTQKQLLPGMTGQAEITLR